MRYQRQFTLERFYSLNNKKSELANIYMQSLEATIYCPNFQCQAPNPESHHFCQQCRTVLPKRYLWAAGNEPLSVRPGTLLADRYWYKWERIVLDTKPGIFPEVPEVLPEAIESYLRLIAYKPQVPQVYAWVPLDQKRNVGLWLLEDGPIYQVRADRGTSQFQEGTLMPPLDMAWSQATGLRQLNWLYQLTQLWEVCLQESVAQSLLTPSLLRVEGSLLRLLELYPTSASLTIADLGSVWQQWVPTAHPTIAPFLDALCQQMIQRSVNTAEQVMQCLDRAIALIGQTQPRQIQIATLTDKGPSRQRNEDACFPESGRVVTFPAKAQEAANGLQVPLAIVCDGIGGHEGGNVASNLAIRVLQERLQALPLQTLQAAPNSLTTQLEQAVLAANDVIAQRNDAEQRQERQRMGTTLVMALDSAHELYITHVGDSRAYRITPMGCHQVTLDDDLASREVRLGYALHWDALRQPGSGSLVQALGMNPSSMLHPTVQRFILDEPCVFLLCSDGLSDNDRVEQNWQSVLLPIFHSKVDVGTAVQQLVAIANLQNGHDNVTVSLVYCQVGAAPAVTVPASLAEPSPNPEGTTANLGVLEPRSSDAESNSTLSSLKTQNLKPVKRNRPNLGALLLGLLIILGGGGLLTFLLLDGSRWLTQGGADNPSVSDPATTIPVLPTPSPSTFRVGTRLLVNQAASGDRGAAPVALLPQPVNTSDAVRASVPLGSVLEVISQRQDALNQQWLGIKVCSLPPAASPTGGSPSPKPAPIAQPGELGWIQEEAIAPHVTSNVSLTDAQLGNCATERRTLPQSP